MKSSTVMKHPELYKETMNTRRQDFTANLTRSIFVAIFDPIAIILMLVIGLCGVYAVDHIVCVRTKLMCHIVL